MISTLTRIKDESQDGKLVHSLWFMAHLLIVFFLIYLFLLPTMNYLLPTTYAIVDPLSSPNNRFGIHIIGTTVDEASPAAQLVNSNGDWGYVTVLVESGSRDHNKWQAFFDDLRRRHLIPLVRLATEPAGNLWKIPYEGEEQAWADFLDSLNWPTKNRYVIIYNEPNQGQEWAGQVDPRSYAQVLDKTITALKNKSPDFFVLNAGFDASAPNKPPSFLDETYYLQQMEEAVPGIFNRLDGWVSHSYPNPGFSGSPDDFGRGTIRTWAWEMEQLKDMKLKKNLPVFITETGWKHSEGLNFDKSLPPASTVAQYLQNAFQNAWNNPKIMAVTPFLLNYQESPFDHFSFKKPTGKPQNLKILGASFPDYYPHFQALLEMPKVAGRPVQENKGSLIKGEIYKSMVAGESYAIPFTVKNTGQSIWNEYEAVVLQAVEGQKELNILPVWSSSDKKIEPGQELTFYLHFHAPRSGSYSVSLQLFAGSKPFDQNPWEFTTEIKSPVILLVNATLSWKESQAGKYLLSVASDVVNSVVETELDREGRSQPIEARYLLPDYTFNFILHKPFYKPKTIQAKVSSGVNKLDFGALDPDFFSALFKPGELWKLLPFSR